MTTIGIIGGTGALGAGLAMRFARAGHQVIIGSRSAARAQAAAAEAGIDGLTGGDNAAAAAADVVVVAIPSEGCTELLAPLAAQLDGTVVVTCVNGLAFGPGGPRPLRPDGSPSWAAAIAEVLPGARIATAFNTVPAGKLEGVADLEGDVLIAAADDEAAAAATMLVEAVGGLRPVHVGGLSVASVIEDLTAVLVSTNTRHKAHTSVQLTGL